ncbi:MAG: hypothetical protein JW994_03760 [Candidatus Omnitrophica bacterium]|nr:hypothetical protein [Candidatus Omnitrophota bacterium]
MDLREMEMKARRNFNNAVCLMSVMPSLMFLYLLTVKVADIKILEGETGYIFLGGIMLLIAGVIMGRKILWDVMKDLFDFNRENLKLQSELIEKNRLATISETTLTLSHELNNPLATAIGNLELLENDFKKGLPPSETVKNRFQIIKNNCDRMARVTSKLSKISKAVSEKAVGDITMISLDKSV